MKNQGSFHYYAKLKLISPNKAIPAIRQLVNALQNIKKKEEAVEEEEKEEAVAADIALLTEIRDLLKAQEENKAE